MPSKADVLRVLIASPSDVALERDGVERAINKWNATHTAQTGVVLLPVRWETDAAPELGDRPQGIINKRMLADCDVLVGIFSTRLGSPTGVAVSGTAEEIQQFQANGRRVMLYFSNGPVPRSALADTDQFNKLKEFKTACQQSGLVSEYSTVDDLQTRLERDLVRAVHHFREDAKDQSAPEGAQAESGQASSTLLVARMEDAIRDSEINWNIELESQPDLTEDGERILTELGNSLRALRISLAKTLAPGAVVHLDGLLAEIKRLVRDTAQMATLGDTGSEFWASGSAIFPRLREALEHITQSMAGASTPTAIAAPVFVDENFRPPYSNRPIAELCHLFALDTLAKVKADREVVIDLRKIQNMNVEWAQVSPSTLSEQLTRMNRDGQIEILSSVGTVFQLRRPSQSFNTIQNVKRRW